MLPSPFLVLTGLRVTAAAASRILPEQRNIAIERWLRGYEEARKLNRADAVIISFGKSGRTWLRFMLSRYYTRKYGLASFSVMEFDELRRRNPSIPAILFTHDNYLRDYTGTNAKANNYGQSKIVLLVRDPRDTAVSQYFQWKHRITPRKKVINAYPLGDMSVYEFIAGAEAGIPKIIRFMNDWAAELDQLPQIHLVRYEDLRANTHRELGRLLAFLGEAPGAAEIEDTVAYASIDNMRRMEADNARRISFNTRLKPGDASDPASFKVRRGKVGGWRDYMTAEEAHRIDLMVRDGLSPVFGYGTGEFQPAAGATS